MRLFSFKDILPDRELTWEELNPTGAKKYCGIFFRNLGKIIKLNFLFLIFCIPIVTIPASFAAMNKISLLLIREEGIFLFSDFLSTFKQEFLSSLKIFVIGFIGCAPAVLIAAIFKDGIKDSTLITIIFGIGIIAALFFLSYTMIALKMLPLIDIRFSALSKNSFILTFTKVLINFPIIIVLLVVFALFYVFFPVSLVLILFPLPSTVNYLITLLYYTIFKKNKIIKEEV